MTELIPMSWWWRAYLNEWDALLLNIDCNNGIEMPYLILEDEDLIAKHYRWYFIIEKDLDYVIQTLKKMINNHNNPYLHNLWESSIITYWRIFAKTKWRWVKLNKHDLENLEEDAVNFHEYIIKIRNECVAHAGDNPFEKVFTWIAFVPDDIEESAKEVSSVFNYWVKMSGWPIEQCKQFLNLCILVLEIVKNKSLKVESKIRTIAKENATERYDIAQTFSERKREFKERWISKS